MLIVYRHCLILKFLFRFQFFCSCTMYQPIKLLAMSNEIPVLIGSWPEPLFRGAGQKERGSGDENVRDSQNLAENEEQRNLQLQRLRESRSLEKVNPYEYKRKLNSKDMTNYKSLVTTLLVERQNRLQLLQQNAAMYRENKRPQHLQD